MDAMDDPREAFAAMVTRASTWLTLEELQVLLEASLPRVSGDDVHELGKAICARVALREAGRRVPS